MARIPKSISPVDRLWVGDLCYLWKMLLQLQSPSLLVRQSCWIYIGTGEGKIRRSYLMAGLGSANAGDDAWLLLHPDRVRQLFQPAAKPAITKDPGSDSPLGLYAARGYVICVP